MNLKMPSVVLFSAFALSMSMTTSAAVIDFQSLENNNSSINPQGFAYSEDGFSLINQANQISQYPFATFGTTHILYQGSTALFNDTVGGTTELTKTGGGAFDLFSIDLAELNGAGVVDVTFNGFFSGGGNITQTFTLDGIVGAFETFLFSGFTGVTKVTWTQDSPFHQFDNITTDVSAVPVPAAALLFAPALLGFIGLRRKAKQTVV